MKNELISVIVPVYNVEKYLNKCIQSIVSQTYKNLEIILVDDGSTDSSPEMCDSYAASDGRVKVMHIRNNYQKNEFNGDIGFIQDINNEKLTVDYFDHIVTYEKNELNELTLAYASSVHKSQGSEYKVVIIPLSTSHYIMLQRNLLYTAITRAKQKVIIIGSKKALMTAIQSNRTQKRYTLLAERLAHKLI